MEERLWGFTLRSFIQCISHPIVKWFLLLFFLHLYSLVGQHGAYHHDVTGEKGQSKGLGWWPLLLWAADMEPVGPIEESTPGSRSLRRGQALRIQASIPHRCLLLLSKACLSPLSIITGLPRVLYSLCPPRGASFVPAPWDQLGYLSPSLISPSFLLPPCLPCAHSEPLLPSLWTVQPPISQLALRYSTTEAEADVPLALPLGRVGHWLLATGPEAAPGSFAVCLPPPAVHNQSHCLLGEILWTPGSSVITHTG